MGLLRKYKSNAKKEFEALRLALDGADATEFNQRLLQKVAPGKSFDRIEDAEVKKLIAKEFARVASKLNGETQRSGRDASRRGEAVFTTNSRRGVATVIHNAGQVETMKWKRRIRYQKYRLNSCNNSAERRRTHANARNDHPF